MDQNQEINQIPTTNNHQYRWLSPLRDIHPSIFGPERTQNTDDNPMSNIDSTLFTEQTPQASVHPRTLKSTSYANDLSVNQLFQWPTMPEYVTSPSNDETPRPTETSWPNNSNTQAIVTETDRPTPSSSLTYPRVNHPMDSTRKDQESTEIHNLDKYGGSHIFNNKSDIGPTQSQANFQRNQRNQQDQIIPGEDYPYTTRYRERLQTKASRQDKHPMPPIGTPATSAEPGTMPAETVNIPERPKKTRSPIRFPSPDGEGTYNSNWNTSNLQSRVGNPNIMQQSPNVKADGTTVDQAPRGFHSQTASDITNRKRVFHNQPNSTKSRNQYDRYREQQTESDVSKFFASIANDISQAIENSYNGERPFKRRPKQIIRKQHDAKGVSNFHLDDNDQIVRTSAGHPRCNYCFIASHPRVGCKFRQYDLNGGIDRAIHPKKGLLSYRNIKEQFEPKIPETSLEHLPHELIEKIGEYLSFTDRCRFGATNRRVRLVLEAEKFWYKVSLPNQMLKYEIINKIINMGTHSLSIPWSTLNGEWQDMDHLDDNISAYTSKLRQLNISGVNESDTVRGNNKIVANLVAKSSDLRILDMTGATLNLLNIVATTLSGGGHMLSSLNLSIVGNNNHHNFVRRYETMKKIIDKLPCLKNIILAGTNLCRKTISYVCTYISTTLERINIAGEKVRDSDLRALTFRCPNITFLNLNGTLVTFESFYDLAITWKHSMRYLSLPKKVAKELGLSLHSIRNYEYLGDLTQLWKRGIVNPRETPALAILAQFKTTIDSMPALKYLNMGEYAEDVIDVERNYKYTLQRLFQHIVINLSPYDDRYPVEEDPISVFQEGFIINTDIQSNPSLSPTSTASTILMEDIGQ